MKVTLMLFLLAAAPARAQYVDPGGAGYLLFQYLIAGLMAVVFACGSGLSTARRLLARLSGFFRRRGD